MDYFTDPDRLIDNMLMAKISKPSKTVIIINDRTFCMLLVFYPAYEGVMSLKMMEIITIYRSQK